MSTNYYQRTDICDKCNRYKEKHIGKSSAAWQFFFRGYVDWANEPKIRSFEDWKRELQKEDSDSKIFNEYGEEISFEEFVKMVEDKQTGKFGDTPNKSHYDYCMENKDVHDYDISKDWKDRNGYSFTSNEFS